MAATIRPVAVNPVVKSFTASAAISGTTSLPVGVTLTAENTVTLATTVTSQVVIGVVNVAVASGEQAPVHLVSDNSVVVMTAGETIAAGEFVSPSTVTAGYVDDADVAGDFIIGMALNAADATELVGVIGVKHGVLAV